MRNPKYPLIALGAYLALIGTFALTTSAPGYTQGNGGPDVRVVNTPEQPVPVKLQTSAPIPVSIQGTAQIDTSSPLPVRDVDNLRQQPVQRHLDTQSLFYTVPAGKRLVIEHVSGSAFADESDRLFVHIRTFAGGSDVRHHLPFTVVHFFGDNRSYDFGGVTKLYADPGTHVSLSYFINTSAHVFASATFSGYLVDLP